MVVAADTSEAEMLLKLINMGSDREVEGNTEQQHQQTEGKVSMRQE